MSQLHAHWRERQGRDAPQVLPHHTGIGVIDQLLAHRSVRHYSDRPLAAGTLELLVAAAQSAASSSNLQAWSVVAVEDPERKSRLATWCRQQAHVRQAPLFLVWVADLSRLDRVADAVGRHADAHRFLEMFLVAAIDATLAAQNAVLAAEALGLGSVYIGALRNHPELVAQELDLPPRAFPLFGLCIGHEDPAHPAAIKPRLPASLVLHRETYRADPAEEATAVREYDERLMAFQAREGLPPVPWSQQAAERVAHADSLSGRHRLADALRRLGFALD